eukprot:CAMPEP_0203671862 /NCGR_PEP_ID=MMETSP0090-20130426/7533_1 /ASSEMBLY_ACC=CAM_ASM_001088 /TAXON_ID=426623 /ORGANISM="Chaetoceros affinis, Strain CCMP159" /LENGTH=508 /DNA_ID=CAMNT_0050537035 /DNA_START=258 /DNA_END=1785 /DNA_ORIENTATION=+
MECFNPGGTGKDRAALYMLRDAEARGELPPPILQGGCYDNNQRDDEQNFDAASTDIDIIKDTNKNDKDQSDNNTISSTIKIAIARSKTGGIVVEGTSGSTGISLSTLSAQRGHSVIIVMPDDQAQEKQTILKCLGAVLHVVPTAAISNPNHYVNVARKIAEEINSYSYSYSYSSTTVNANVIQVGKCGRKGKVIKAAFMNQFENEANYAAHYSTTGPEIFEQSGGEIDAFCMSSGTGGTISGVGQYLKDHCSNRRRRRRGNNNNNHQNCKIVLIDPPGSALYNKIKYNIAYATEQKERALLRHRYDTIAEGIGLDRITKNFALGVESGVIDDAIRIQDQDAVDVAHWLLREEGLFVGSSSAMNVAGAIRLVVDSKSDSDLNFDSDSVSKSESNSLGGGNDDYCVVTVICDGGQRHLTRFWNRDFIVNWGLLWPGDDERAWMDRLLESLGVDLFVQIPSSKNDNDNDKRQLADEQFQTNSRGKELSSSSLSIIITAQRKERKKRKKYMY